MVSGGEIFVIIMAILILFGAKSIPEVARGLGKGLREIKKVTDDIKKEITQETGVMDDINDFKKNLGG
jgi:sec-independent protein translocase protein TatA